MTTKTNKKENIIGLALAIAFGFLMLVVGGLDLREQEGRADDRVYTSLHR